MTKGPTKAQLALAETREWIEASKMEVAEREAALLEARSQLQMHETIYAILEKTFTRQVGKVAGKKAGRKASKALSSKSGARCQAELVSGATCNMTASHDIHNASQKEHYAESHEFLAKRSPRASSLQQQIQGRTKAANGRGGLGLCISRITVGDDEVGDICNAHESDPIHDPLMGYAGYHEFQPAEQAASASVGD